MAVDPDNPVVRILVAGLEAELRGDRVEARGRYDEAWASRADDSEAAMAAHYLARVQDDPADRLRWNREAVERAEAAPKARVAGSHSSLYLNLGFSDEAAGHPDEARACYQRALERIRDLPPGQYRDAVDAGVEAALARTGAGRPRRSR